MALASASRSCTITLHDDRISHLDVLGGTDILPVGSIALLSSKDATDIFVLADGRSSSPREISLHVRLGSKFGFTNRTAGKLVPVQDEDQVTATHINLFVRDQYLTRSDIWLMTKQLEGKVVYEESHLHYLGHDAAVLRDIHLNGKNVGSALVQQGKTKAIVRSGSARFTILIQLSKEMLAYGDACCLVFETMIEGYLAELAIRWESSKAKHQLSVVVFGRSSGQDFYKVISAGSSGHSWIAVMSSLRQLFNNTYASQDLSLAADGNMLEAMHLAALDFLDSSQALQLANTGTSIIAITAGTGAFEADYLLLRKTTQMLLGNSIGIDVVSLAAKPQHPVPLFRYKIDGKVEYALPHWADISYWPSDHASIPAFAGAITTMTEVALPLLPTAADELVDLLLAMESSDQMAFGPVVQHSIAGTRHAAIIFPSTSHGSAKTITAEPIITESQPPKMSSHPPPLKQKASSSSVATNLSIVKPPQASASSILSARKISVGPRGLAPLKSGAITTITEAHANLGKDILVAAKFVPNEAKSGLANQIRATLKRRPSQASILSRTTDLDDRITQPIDIQAIGTPVSEALPVINDNTSTHEGSPFAKLVRSTSKTPTAFEGLAASPHKPSVDPGAEARTPWLALLNPCNIKRDNMRVATQYRQWQHVFPKAIDSAEFKWTSMCTPASLPLYNDLMPSTDDLKNFYKRTTRRIVCAQAGELGKRPHELLRQLVTMRLAHGFQIVARPTSTEQAHIFMSIGADYHELQCLSDLELEVVEYTHKQASYVADMVIEPFAVQPWHELSSQATSLRPTETLTIDWAAVDQSVDTNLATESLFHMRFVLLPTEILGRDQQDLADDEKRIEGIQRLTQQWQRHRVLTAEDQSHLISIARKKGGQDDDLDLNPLAIEYHTRDPSALVNTQDVAVSGQQETTVPLFAESERYHSSTFDLAKLVKRMQEPPPRGVDVRDRRWFTRIHLRCFRGDEMTNWLLSAFKDLKSRDDAVDIGNVLMERGVFTHVRHKHDFMDGNYFYQIAQAHRIVDYPNVIASVFNRAAGRSIPPTPSSEVRQSPLVRPVRGDSESTGPDSSMLTAVEKRQVLLTQTLKYNVDPARRSEQEEVVNIHYDRIHNPENCYHIYIDWSLASPMLIRDAVAKWSTLVEPYGLRLVQIPWPEASEHSERHPFEQPRYIKLALDPPERVPATPFLSGLTSSSKYVEDQQFYYKSILRQLDFVLDIESSASFSDKIDIVVTWGKMDFGMTQFVHRSGLVVAQICNDRSADFLLLPNTLASERASAPSRAKSKDTVMSILAEFEDLAQDVKRLREVYDESQKPRVVAPSPFVRAAMAGADFDVPPMQLSPLVLGRGG